MKLIDRTGQRVGRLEVLERTSKPPNVSPDDTGAWWLCRCDCGKRVPVAAQRLQGRKPRLSCGCDTLRGKRGELGDA